MNKFRKSSIEEVFSFFERLNREKHILTSCSCEIGNANFDANFSGDILATLGWANIFSGINHRLTTIDLRQENIFSMVMP